MVAVLNASVLAVTFDARSRGACTFGACPPPPSARPSHWWRTDRMAPGSRPVDSEARGGLWLREV